jgi:hypothetical protein
MIAGAGVVRDRQLDCRVRRETHPDRGSNAARSCSPEHGIVGQSTLVRDDHARRRAAFYVPGGLWVRGLPFEITASMLRACFEQYGNVDKIVLLQKRQGCNESAYVYLEEAGTGHNILRGKYGSLIVPGSRHVIDPMDIKPLERLVREAVRSSGSSARRPPHRDDWKCPACGNLVWASKNSCGWIFHQDGSVCGARRPAAARSRDHLDKPQPPQTQYLPRFREKAAGRKGQRNGDGGRASDHVGGLSVWDADGNGVGGVEAGPGNAAQHTSAPPDLEPLSDGELDPRFMHSSWMRLSRWLTMQMRRAP